MLKLWNRTKAVWRAIGNIWLAKDLAAWIVGPTALVTVLGAIAVRLFTPLSLIDTVIVAAACGALAFFLACRFAPRVHHVHHHSATVTLSAAMARGVAANFGNANAPSILLLNPAPLAEASLSPAQESLLGFLKSYMRQFAANKLVIDRTTGALVFDNDPERGKGINLLQDLFGSIDQAAQIRFVDLMESMPSQYVTFLPEMRWDSPFVVRLTQSGLQYQHK